MGLNEFGAAPWLSYAILGFLLCVGYLIWRGMQARKSRAEQWAPRRQNALEKELQAEIDRAAAEQEAAQPPAEDLALDLPAEERQRLEELRRRLEREEPR